MTLTHQTDQKAQAIALLLQQFKDKAFVTAFLSSFTEQVQAIEDMLYDLLTERSLDASTGAQLDGIGRILSLVRDGRNDADYRGALRIQILILKNSGLVNEIHAIVIGLMADTYFYVMREGPESVDIDVSADLGDEPTPLAVAKRLREFIAAGVRAVVAWDDMATSIPVIPADNTLHWPLDEAIGSNGVAHDSSGNGHDSNVSPANTWQAPGLALTLGETPNQIKTPITDILAGGATSFQSGTLSIMFTPDVTPANANHSSTSNAYSALLAFDPGVGLFIGNLDNVGTVVVFACADAHSAATYANCAKYANPAGVVSVWTLTYDAPHLKLYLNGLLVDSVNVANADGDNTPLRLGDDNFGHAAAGLYQHVQVFNRPLTADEVLANYQAITGATVRLPAFSLGPSNDLMGDSSGLGNGAGTSGGHFIRASDGETKETMV